MTVPLVVLALFSILAGFLGGWFERFVGRSVPNVSTELSHSSEVVLVALSILLSLSGLLLAACIYLWRKFSPERIASSFGFLYRLVYNKYYFDEIYNFVFVRGVGFVTGGILSFFDRYVIDGVVNGLAAAAKGSSELLRLTQTGVVNTYVAYFVVGMVLFTVIIWLY